MMNQIPCPKSIQEDKIPLCIEKSQTIHEDLQEHTGSPLLVEEEEDKLLDPLSPSNPASFKECSRQDEGNFLPLWFSSFDYLNQRMKISNQAREMEARNGVMELFRMDDGENEKMKPIVHPIFPFL